MLRGDVYVCVARTATMLLTCVTLFDDTLLPPYERKMTLMMRCYADGDYDAALYAALRYA